jgi:DNA-binding NarL/FixJ family response regulator
VIDDGLFGNAKMRGDRGVRAALGDQREHPLLTPLGQLTQRQQRVLALIAEGRSNAAIAAHLCISEKTVVNHITSIYDTLELKLSDDSHRRVQAVLAYLSNQ